MRLLCRNRTACRYLHNGSLPCKINHPSPIYRFAQLPALAHACCPATESVESRGGRQIIMTRQQPHTADERPSPTAGRYRLRCQAVLRCTPTRARANPAALMSASTVCAEARFHPPKSKSVPSTTAHPLREERCQASGPLFRFAHRAFAVASCHFRPSRPSALGRAGRNESHRVRSLSVKWPEIRRHGGTDGFLPGSRPTPAPSRGGHLTLLNCLQF